MQTTLNETGAKGREFTSSIKPADAWTQSFRVVLHCSESGEWVTHCENLNPDGSRKERPDFYWGHYFRNDYAAAFKDYVARCAKYRLDI